MVHHLSEHTITSQAVFQIAARQTGEQHVSA